MNMYHVHVDRSYSVDQGTCKLYKFPAMIGLSNEVHVHVHAGICNWKNHHRITLKNTCTRTCTCKYYKDWNKISSYVQKSQSKMNKLTFISKSNCNGESKIHVIID